MHICTALKVKNLLSSSPSSHEIGIWTGWSANPVTSFSTDQPVTTPLANNNEHNGIFISYSLWVISLLLDSSLSMFFSTSASLDCCSRFLKTAAGFLYVFFLRIYFFCFLRELLWGGYRAVCYGSDSITRFVLLQFYLFLAAEVKAPSILECWIFACWKPVWDPHVSRDQDRILSNNLKWPKGMRSSNIIDTGGDRYRINTALLLKVTHFSAFLFFFSRSESTVLGKFAFRDHRQRPSRWTAVCTIAHATSWACFIDTLDTRNKKIITTETFPSGNVSIHLIC